jgi:hypothetical protein
MADLAYAQAETSLLSYADDTVLADGVATVDDCRRAYEAVRAELLDDYPDLDGSTIGDVLGEAAGAVWPSIIHDL